MAKVPPPDPSPPARGAFCRGLWVVTSDTRQNKSGLVACRGLPWWLSGNKFTCRRFRRLRYNPWIRKIPWRRAWQLQNTTQVFLLENPTARGDWQVQSTGSLSIGLYATARECAEALS